MQQNLNAYQQVDPRNAPINNFNRQQLRFQEPISTQWPVYSQNPPQNSVGLYQGLQSQMANNGFQNRVQYNTINSNTGLPSSDFYNGAPQDSILSNGLQALAGFASSTPRRASRQFNVIPNQYQTVRQLPNSYNNFVNYPQQIQSGFFQNQNPGLSGYVANNAQVYNSYPVSVGARQAGMYRNRNGLFAAAFNPRNVVSQPAYTQPLRSQLLAHIALRNRQILRGDNTNQQLPPLKQSQTSEESDEDLTIGQYDQSRGGGDLTSIHEYLYGEGIVFKRK